MLHHRQRLRIAFLQFRICIKHQNFKSSRHTWLLRTFLSLYLHFPSCLITVLCFLGNREYGSRYRVQLTKIDSPVSCNYPFQKYRASKRISPPTAPDHLPFPEGLAQGTTASASGCCSCSCGCGSCGSSCGGSCSCGFGPSVIKEKCPSGNGAMYDSFTCRTCARQVRMGKR